VDVVRGDSSNIDLALQIELTESGRRHWGLHGDQRGRPRSRP